MSLHSLNALHTHTQQQQTNDLPWGLHYLIRTMDINTDIQWVKKKKKKKSVLPRRALRRHPRPGKGERPMKVMSVIHEMRQGEKASKGPAWVKAAHEKQRSADTSCCVGIKQGQEGAKVNWQRGQWKHKYQLLPGDEARARRARVNRREEQGPVHREHLISC